jgi:ribonuclease PH
MNIVMTGNGRFVEIQGTAEGEAFSRKEMDDLINMADSGIKLITQKQIEAIGILS